MLYLKKCRGLHAASRPKRGMGLYLRRFSTYRNPTLEWHVDGRFFGRV
ncbi:MAG: hypothetical protein AVDCRST_MAG86-824 [uncultured Truepera sp.]|uniref:Uncharacterized protein n=1 Tax=uncultured Truepera sp. TaxID=543023 RepID=A0A6J4UY49_9DEIN|nr:MAG: hypothetical protein AVDCRST_MAG86-824 [uncultured Truepera sp.]